MNTRSEFMSSRLKEVLLDGKWIAQTNVKEQIKSVTWKQATKKVGSLNTIALLTYHLNYYLEGITQVFLGGNLEIRDKFSFDMPPIHSEKEWSELVESFVTNSKLFIERVELMKDSMFDEPFVHEKYGTYQRNIEGVIEHSYYHLGQISLIKKILLDF
ncbi:DUF1572 domain-containing protein [Muricauda sp. HICW]|uniref:DUF1572 domain-containing protein n=1 Tax=Flagellimonas chongwuensis TaxID=2697365 RepID=A0A850NHU1_9FLAO|nr:DinB family protein [Allomuricauda chongwuensis]NVN16737.1 DUF1572 domain-containing protein [Allomuricauda chongwuensis]